MMKLVDQNGLQFRSNIVSVGFDTCLNQQLPKLVVFALYIT